MVQPTESQTGVSVIIPCYNAGQYLDEAVESVFFQNTDVPYEVIIVDDGSQDAFTLDKISYYEQRSSHFLSVIRHEENKGLAATRNTAIAASQYNIILPLDADDRLVKPDQVYGGKGYIDLGFAMFEADQDLDVVSPQAYMFGNINGLMRFPCFDEKRELYKNHIPAFSMVRKSVLEDVGGYNSTMRFAEDWDLWVAVANKRFKDGKEGGFSRLDQPVMEYRTHDDGSNLAASFKSVSSWPIRKMIERSPEIYEKHFSFVPDEVLPRYMQARKLAYLGKLCLKSIWSDNASTFMANKISSAKALISHSLMSNSTDEVGKTDKFFDPKL